MQSTTYIAQHSTHQHIDGVRWKRFAQLAALPAHGELQLLEDVRGASRSSRKNAIVACLLLHGHYS